MHVYLQVSLHDIRHGISSTGSVVCAGIQYPHQIGHDDDRCALRRLYKHISCRIRNQDSPPVDYRHLGASLYRVAEMKSGELSNKDYIMEKMTWCRSQRENKDTAPTAFTSLYVLRWARHTMVCKQHKEDHVPRTLCCIRCKISFVSKHILW